MPTEPQSDTPKGLQKSDRLPFEPNKKRQKSAKPENKQPETPKKLGKQPQTSKKLPEAQKSDKTPPFTKEEMAVPKVVSDRMARRMAAFCGIPTVLGMATFVASYLIVSHGWFKLPNLLVMVMSMGFFGLGVLGLTYGVLSASWDEEIAGSKLGWQEFTANWGRMMSAWRATRQKNV